MAGPRSPELLEAGLGKGLAASPRMSPRLLVASLALSALIAVPRAQAGSGDPGAPNAPNASNTSLTIEPILLVLPMIDATLEYSPTPHLGLAVTAGYAKVLFVSTLYDLGARANIYVRDDFKGPHLGVQLRELWGDSDFTLLGAKGDNAMTSSTEKIVGVYAGYKWIRRWGLTAVVQLGIGRMTTASTNADEPRTSEVIPVGNLEVGKSW
jgi:hypothetical protein